MLDLEVLGAEIAAVVVEQVREATAPLRDEIAALKRELAERPQPIDGKDADPAVIASMVAEAVAALPPPRAGKDADPEAVRALVAEAVAAIPPPKDGASVTLDDVAPLVVEAVERAVAALPMPKDGEPGKDGAAAPVVAAAIKDHEGELILTLTDGTILRTGIFDGKDGKDGEPGLGFDDIDLTLAEDGRTVVFGLERGDLKQSFELGFPVMLYRGVYRPGDIYEQGDTVTWGGSLWHCDAKTADKPGEGLSPWTLAAKRGRDGRDAVATEKARPGPIQVGVPSK